MHRREEPARGTAHVGPGGLPVARRSEARRALLRGVAVAALIGLAAAWSLCKWGHDESLPSTLATHLPAAAYGLVAVAALAAAALAHSKAALLAALACVYIALFPLGGYVLPSQPRASVSSAVSHRVLTWNVEQWSYGGAALARAVAELQPDVFCLQEARNYDTDEDQEWPAFEAGLPGYHLVREGEMALGTRWPIIEQRRTPLHAELIKRPLLELILQSPEGAHLRVLDAHLVYAGYFGSLPASLVPSARARRAQAEQILQHLGESTLPTLLCGDLNAPPNSAALAILKRRLSDAWTLRGAGFGFTISSRVPVRRIDYLLVEGIAIGEVRVVDAELSDHRAVLATFGLGVGGGRGP